MVYLEYSTPPESVLVQLDRPAPHHSCFVGVGTLAMPGEPVSAEVLRWWLSWALISYPVPNAPGCDTCFLTCAEEMNDLGERG